MAELSFTDVRTGVYDWLLEYDDIDPYLRLIIAELQPDFPLCVFGCGTSTLSEILAGWTNRTVWSVDYDPAVINHMISRTSDNNMLKWETVDLSILPNNSASCQNALSIGSFCSVLDKGTFDAMICEGLGGTEQLNSSSLSSSSLFLNASRVLQARGKLVLISLHPPLLLVRLLSVPQLGFEDCLMVKVVRAKSGLVCTSHPNVDPSSVDSLEKGEFTLVVATRSSQTWEEMCKIGVDSLSSIVASAHSQIFDHWFTKQRPLLTSHRVETLSSRWIERAILRSKSLSLMEAYQVMFTSDERSEYTYSYFLEDIAQFETLVPNELTLSEAETFIEMNQ